MFKSNGNLYHFTMNIIEFCILFILILTFPSSTRQFPQGAPSDVCETFSPERGHRARPSPISEAPYQFIQYGRRYQRGQMMVVEILTKNNDNDDNRDSEPITFKGFIVQALDPNTLKFIGRFMPGEGLNMMAECSAVTHQNNRLKTSATFLWMPPDDRNFGEVIFRYD
ncbi:hypothetical protein RDWZM_004329 [Blomia tropicalis]|uniref:Reelin domain-containing protein n=1 Tax=Blomia tropicalis TaxID=40697 RepID=A0A9Q0MHU5_BLOTA|nr:hypothetical protein RDWZM_004329 [Blomia tropicalis]